MARLPRMPGGVLIPARVTYAQLRRDLSDITEAGAQPGTPEPAEGVVYEVRVAGGQGDDLEAIAIRSGHPGSMSVGYRLGDEGDDAWRGWNPPNWWDGHQVIASGVQEVDLVTLPRSQQAVLLQRFSTRVQARTVGRDLGVGGVGAPVPRTRSWDRLAACVVPDDAATGGARIVLLFGGRTHQSRDAGQTWSPVARHPFTVAQGGFGACRMAWRRGEILLLVEDSTTTDRLHQFASTDGGSTFSHVATHDGMGDGVQVVSTDRGFVVAYRTDTEGDNREQFVLLRRIPHAHRPLSQAVEQRVSLGTMVTAARPGLAAEPGGTLWLYGTAVGGATMGCAVSRDHGESWTRLLGAAAGGSTYLLTGLACAAAAGRVLVAHGWEDGDAAYTDGLGLLALGGWSNWTTGPIMGVSLWDYHARTGSGPGWAELPGLTAVTGAVNWTAVLQPDGAGWSDSGTASTTLGDGWLTISGSSTSRIFHRATTASASLVAKWEWVLDEHDGSAVVGVTLRAADGDDDFWARVELAVGELIVRDIFGSVLATIDTEDDDPLDTGAPIQCQAVLTEGGRITCGWRRPGRTRWAIAVSDVELTPNPGIAEAAGRITWGQLTSGDCVSRWRWLTAGWALGSAGEEYQPRLYTGPSALYGRIASGDATPIPDAAGPDGAAAWLRATAGPAREGERVALPVHYARGVHRAHGELCPSPSTPWEALDSDERTLVYDLGERTWLGAAIGVLAHRVTVPAVYLDHSDDGEDWQEAATLDLSVGLSGLTYRRRGDTITVGAGSAEAARYLWDGELDGGLALLDGSVSARIVEQTAGSWLDGDVVQPQIRLGDRTSLPGSSGSLTLYAPSGVLVFYPEAQVLKRFWRLRLPAHSAPEGRTSAGILQLGMIEPWGAECDLTRSDVHAPNVRETRSSWGTSRVRELGPVGRRWRFGWTDGTHRGRLRSGLDVDYVGAPGGLPLRAGEDVGDQVASILRRLRGGQIPCTVIEPLPIVSTTITDPTRWLYGRLLGQVSIDGMAGDPVSRHEFDRIEAVTADELV